MREARVLIAFVLAALTPLSTSAPRGSESFSALASATPAAPPTGAVIIPTAAGAAGAAAAECTLPVIPDEYTVAGVPDSDDFQVVVRLKSDSDLQTKFMNFGMVHAALIGKKEDVTAESNMNRYNFNWTSSGSDTVGSSEPFTVFTGTTESMLPWHPLVVRDCHGNVIASLTAVAASAASASNASVDAGSAVSPTSLAYSIHDAKQATVGRTSPTNLHGDLLLYDMKGAVVSKIHPEVAESHQSVTVMDAAKGTLLADPRLLVFLAANKGLVRDQHAAEVEDQRAKGALGFLTTAIIIAGVVVLIAAVACLLSCRFGLINLGSGFQDDGADLETTPIMKTRRKR